MKNYALNRVANTKPKRSWLSALITLSISISIILLIFYQRQNIHDLIALQGYNPPAEISNLSNDIKLTKSAEKVFFVNKPAVLDKEAFNSACPNGGNEQTIILGCYHGNQNGIFIYKVDDVRLSGVMQVTSAHEMLHAAYDRLSSNEKKRINKLLKDFYNNQLEDNKTKDVVKAYYNTEPNDIENEMHSIFGSEIANLPAELEDYYSSYFTNRSAVVKYATDYKSEFYNRENQVKAYDERLSVMRTDLDNMQNSINIMKSQLDFTRRGLNDMQSFDDYAQYKQSVDSYNTAVLSYNKKLADYKIKADEYNDLVNTRNAIAVETKELVKAIDSHLDPVK